MVAEHMSNKLDSLNQSHGKDFVLENETERKEKVRKLEKIYAVHRQTPFKTNDLAIFEENLEKMNMIEMQNMAIASLVPPYGTRVTLKNRLLRAFREARLSESVSPEVSSC